MRVLRRLSALGPVAVALVVLVAIGVVTVAGVDGATTQAERQRIKDRLLLARAASGPLAAWLEAGRIEARQLAAAAGTPASAAAAVAEYARGPRAFGASALVVDPRLVVIAGTPDYLGSVRRPVTLCTERQEDEAGKVQTVEETGFRILVERASTQVSSVLALPATCRPGLGVAARTPSGAAAAVLAGLDSVRQRTAEAAAVVPDLTVLVVLPDGTTLANGQELPSAGRTGLSALIGDGTTPRAARHQSGDAKYVGAFQPVGDGWGVVVDQEAEAFDESPTERSTFTKFTTVGILVAVFAAAFALVAWFDIRRRRSARRADVHRNAFLSIVGHELRTPLTVIKGYTETLASRWEALDDRSRQMLVESMAPQTQRQARVIEHLLTAAALQAGTFATPPIGEVDVATVIGQVVDEFDPLAPLHDFTVGIAPRVGLVRGDPAALSQALGELVDNAVKYSPSGGTVTITARRAGRGIEIAVEDEGVGLPATAAIFDAFVQGEDVDRRVHDEGGVGVGLYIARSLVEAMGGTVDAQPQPGGARFMITLRAVRAPDPVPTGGTL
jgi:signal transduction histidine kinase